MNPEEQFEMSSENDNQKPRRLDLVETSNGGQPGPESLTSGLAETADRLARRPWPARPIRPDVNVSFEYFPTTGDDAAADLIDCATRLDALGPRFVSVTYGAGGTSQDRTFATVERLQPSVHSPVAGHLTTVGASKSETDAVIDRYLELGVRHIVALRGDPPADGNGSDPSKPGYQTATDLVAAIRGRVDKAGLDRAGDNVTISVAAYPEVHPKATSAKADLDNLKAKLDAGADQAITQFFYDNESYLRFVERCLRSGITAPIVAGIMPVTSFKRVANFAGRCGTTIPPWMDELYRGLDEAPDVHQLVSATLAAEQCRQLAEHGVRNFHFYTMNRPELSLAVGRILAFDQSLTGREARPAPTAAAAAKTG